MKKTIVFFSRSELTYLYGSVQKEMETEFNVIHVAYSYLEQEVLKNEFNIEADYVLKEIFEQVNDDLKDRLSLEDLDSFLINTTKHSFNLNASFQANRSSKYLSYDNNIELVKTYYLAWEKIFNENVISFFIHEPVSLLMNQIAASFCKKVNAVYSTHILVKGEDENKFSFIMVDGYQGYPTSINKEIANITYDDVETNIDRITSFIGEFRSGFKVFFSQLGTGDVSNLEYYKLFLKHIGSKLLGKIKKSKLKPVLDNIEVFIEKDDLLGRRVKNLKKYRSELKYDDYDPSKIYYFYPMHLEPEAVVLYWANNRYTNQIKLIENIASQLPPDVFLYVKDHPHSPGYRSIEDYERLQAVPNIKLLNTKLSGKEVISNSLGVITINGTGGFEALLMNKHVITFGSSFYQGCSRVFNLENVFELQPLLYALRNVEYEDDYELRKFVLAYLNSHNDGFTDFYGAMHKKIGINVLENGKIVANSLKNWINNN